MAVNDTARPETLSIHGPIISTNDLDAHVALFAAFGLEEAARCERSCDETQAIWGIDAHGSSEVTLAAPGTPFGIRLIRFDPGSDEQIRDPSRGSDCNALKVIDFYAPDLPAARTSIEHAGFMFKPEVADYDTPEGRYQEAHLWGPDGVVCALISGDPALFTDLATLRDRLVSEPQSISGPVQDAAGTLDFFDRVLGLQVIHRYGLEDASFDAMVGSATQLRLRAWNVGTRKSEPYFGVIDYGLPARSQQSLHETARPPRRGLLGATIRVRDAAAVAKAAAVATVSVAVPGFGKSVIATVQGPNGAWYQAIEAVSPSF
jgi:catechol 2,3-dioxygenase-like lactoylglutathione lyase family enzyme